MALTPQTDPAFLREVDEELRRDQLGQAWRRYGKALIALILVGLALFGGYLWWQANSESRAGEEGEHLSAALDDLSGGRPAQADAKFKAIVQGDNPAYRAIAQLAQAARKFEAGDAKGAIAAYRAIETDSGIAQPFRDTALIKGVAAAFDTMPPQVAIDRLKPLAQPGAPWFGSAAEMTAIAYLKLNQPQKAAAIFNELAKSTEVPETLRARAVRISGALDERTSAPSAPQKEKTE